ncbi:MAG: ATP synthase F0 subunit B [Bacteroidetes bacterium CG12_big_fil_rev_8_21_14_0_65_60_17]|nr:MAG: ATP synthase F0 subunit B [Bacteroidetes bacterium CG12_big_fil_rev_8_21_14_0_65_60_17]
MVLAADLLSPNAGLIVWIGITFGILLILLRKFAWGPITSALTTRESTIQDSLDQAKNALAEARAVQADNTRARREAEADAQRIMREARDAAEKLRSEEVEKTRAQLRQMQEQAEADIEREKQNALNMLREEVAHLAVDAAGKILRDTLGAEHQKKIVNDMLGDLSRN